MSRTRLYFLFLFVLLLIAGSLFVATPAGTTLAGLRNKFDFHLGLDLKGGSQLIYEGDLKDIAGEQKSEAMESLRSAIERRIQGKAGGGLGVTEPLIQIAGDDRLIVELPGLADINLAIQVIGQTPFLEFREIPAGQASDISDNPEEWARTGLTGKNLDSAAVEFDPQSGRPVISLQFDGEGASLFEDITKRNVGRPIAVFLDNELLQAPTVQSTIAGGQAIISGDFSIDDAKLIATRLNSGALPVPIRLIGQQTVGATLGESYLEKSVLAGLIGFLAIFLFMIIFYRLPGLIASVALTIYILLSLAVFKLLSLTLTLAGIAGFILSIGMAVDANILIFERVKEELRLGKDIKQSLHEGFTRAWLSIRDSNVSTLITTFILGYFGTSIVRGFAVALSVGVILSMFTAITVTRTLLFLFLGRKNKALTRPWLYGVRGMAK